jgi:hypothetical protein
VLLPNDSDQPRAPSGQADSFEFRGHVSGDDISESGAIKGVVLWLLVGLFLPMKTENKIERWCVSKIRSAKC